MAVLIGLIWCLFLCSGHAAADTSAKDEHMTKDATSPLGLVPHQVRFQLPLFIFTQHAPHHSK